MSDERKFEAKRERKNSSPAPKDSPPPGMKMPTPPERPPMPPAAKSETRRVKVGDIVLYAHRRIHVGPNGEESHTIPMIVTSVASDGTSVSGCVFSELKTVCVNGVKVLEFIKKGDGVDRWKFPR